jgi:hypothetical protein
MLDTLQSDNRIDLIIDCFCLKFDGIIGCDYLGIKKEDFYALISRFIEIVFLERHR